MSSKCGAQMASHEGVEDTMASCCTRLDAQGREALARIGKALSDPIRLEMLDIMAQGRACCELPDPATRGVPGVNEPTGICVCEFQEQFGLGQSKISYHLGVLKEAGLIHVEGRGKWSFYAIDREAVAEAVQAFGELLRVEASVSRQPSAPCTGLEPRGRSGVGGGRRR